MLRTMLTLLPVLLATAACADEPAANWEPHGSAEYRARVEQYFKGRLDKIIDGKAALAGQFPWQVSLGATIIQSAAGAHFCGGALYAASWVVTAAHCVDGNLPEDIIITAGTVDLKSGGQRAKVAGILINAAYHSPKAGNDIALLRLETPLAIDGMEVAAIPLLPMVEEPQRLATREPVTVSGFGYTAEGGEISAKLNFIGIPVAARDDCNSPLSYDGKVRDDMFCAGLSDGGTDSCNADSGGPVVVGTGGSARLAGIVSWGEGCARPLKYGVYVRAAAYADWVAACVTGNPQCTIRDAGLTSRIPDGM